MNSDSGTRQEIVRQAPEQAERHTDPLPPRLDPATPAPLTRFQEGLWFNAMLAAETDQTSDPRPVAFRLLGPLDVDAITTAVHMVQERHPVLRTVFPAQDNAPTQVVTEQRADVAYHDLSTSTGAPDIDEIRGFARSLALLPFDIETQSPFRPHVVRIGDNDHLLLLAMHHLVFDGWSMEILRWELEHCYSAALGDRAEAPTPIEFDTADFAAWERSQEDPEMVQEQLAYWRERLEGLEGDLELPEDHPASADAYPAPVVFDLEPDLAARFSALGRAHGATPFMMLLAASQVLAARLSRQHDFAVAVATAGRTDPAVERLIGCFINVMLVRTRLPGDMTFTEAIAAARDEVLGGLANQGAPFSRIISEHRGAGSREPFRMLVQRRSFPTLPSVPTAGLSWEPFDLHMPAAAALTVEGHHEGSSLRVTMSYDPGLFRPETVARWAGHLRTLIESAVAAPDTPIWELPLLRDAERDQVIRGFNEPIVIGSPLLAPDWVAAQADANPDDVAFEDGERALTYRELLEEADGIAEQVRALGAGRGSRIVVYMEPGLDAAVAVLGLLRSGAAYVPADPSVSASWLRTIALETEPLAVITHRRSLPGLGDLDVPTLAFEDLAGPVTGRVPTVIEPDDVAYVCFTSGSTGTPKGVVITHGNVAAVLENQTYCRYGPGSRVLQMYSIAFDGYVTGLLGPLVSGATAVLYEREALGSAQRFLGWCAEKRITHMGIPTSLFHTYVDEMVRSGLSFPPVLEHVALGGEELRSDAVETFYSLRHPRLRLHNTYGPTETTVWVLRKDLSAQSPDPLGRIPIGSPVPNAWVYVLDERGQPAPVGVAGELLIGGSQVGRGYLGKPELTAARFIPDPFAMDPAGRAYRTGDLGRWLPSGEIEFLGRIDRQVKVRGFRVEPEAVETVLRRHPAVRDAAVVDAPAADGTIILRAYVVPEGAAPSGQELRSWCRESLPDFTVPASFTDLDELPRTISRKLDRARLPEPVAKEPSISERSPIGVTVASIWSKVLDLDDIPAGGNFFALGGHPLIAMRVIGRVSKAFDVEVPLTTLFNYPTIEAFAAQIEGIAGLSAPGTDVDDLLSSLADLDPDEVAALLDEIDPSGGA